MLQRFGRPLLVRLSHNAFGHCFFSTNPCLLRRSQAGNASVPPSTTRNGRPQDQLKASFPGTAHRELNAFLANVNRRLENLLYSTTARMETLGKSVSDEDYEQAVTNFKEAVMSNLTEKMKRGDYTSAPERVPTPKELFDRHSREGIPGLDKVLLKHFKDY